MDYSRSLSLGEVNKTALDHFIYQPVSRDMIAYLAAAAHNVISCDSTPSPPSSTCSSSSATPSPPPAEDLSLPTVEEFITQLVVSSNVQVPTLMSTLVYLNRLKSKLQPLARGLRCTTHRIFLASLILAAKYLNDSSPKNKHWANYTHITTDAYSFGFSRTEVNLMEKQLLFLLEWDLRIVEEDLYRDLDAFLSPLKEQVVERHARKLRQREEKRRQKELEQLNAAATVDPMQWPMAMASSHPVRHPSPEQMRTRSSSSDSSAVSPPSLSYSSSASSYASSTSSSRQQSRSNTPSEEDTQSSTTTAQHKSGPYYYDGTATAQSGSLYDSPVEIVLDELHSEACMPKVRVVDVNSRGMLPYEISAREYQRLHADETSGGVVKRKQRRGMWARMLGNAVAVR